VDDLDGPSSMHVEPSPTLDQSPVTEMPTNNQATSTSLHKPAAKEQAAETDAREDIPGTSMSDYPHAPDHPAPRTPGPSGSRRKSASHPSHDTRASYNGSDEAQGNEGQDED
jgi:hypothetical protein